MSLAPAGHAAPTATIVRSQAGLEWRMLMSNGEQILLTLIIPIVLLIVAVLACGACNRAGQHDASYAAAPAQDAVKRELAASEQADDALGAMLAYEHDATIALPAERIPERLQAVRDAGINVCCGGILGMGETETDRVALLHTLATLPQHPESVPINQLVQVPGTPLHGLPELDPLDLVRAIATARLLLPKSYVRLSAGRTDMSDSVQALCFLAGANSIFYGEKLLTTGNPDTERDLALFARLGLRPMQIETAKDDSIDALRPGSGQACSTTVHAGITEAA